MKKFALFILTVLAVSPAMAREVKPACGIVPTWETCVSEPVLIGETWKTLSRTETDCEAGQALPELIAALQQAGVEPKGIRVTCTYEQLGREPIIRELTL